MKVYELLSSPEKWIKYDIARDENGNVVEPCDENAICWCLLGALQKCYMFDYLACVRKLSSVLAPGVIGADFVATFNDSPETVFGDVINICKELDL